MWCVVCGVWCVVCGVWCVVWLLSNSLVNSLSHLFFFQLFSVFWVSLGGSIDTEPLLSIDKAMAQTMVSILFAVLKLIAMNLFISLVSYLFGRAYNKARATALLQSANYILSAEMNLSMHKIQHVRKRMRIECNPLVCSF